MTQQGAVSILVKSLCYVVYILILIIPSCAYLFHLESYLLVILQVIIHIFLPYVALSCSHLAGLMNFQMILIQVENFRDHLMMVTHKQLTFMLEISHLR